MFATREVLLRARLDAKTLRAYIEAGWLLPRHNGHAFRFSEADLARARLIRDLKRFVVHGHLRHSVEIDGYIMGARC